MAEGFSKLIFTNDNISSAGLYVNQSDKVSKNSVLAMKDYNIDISSHKPTQLSLEMIKNADYIVPMTENHKSALLSVGVSEDKILMFENEILDPYGMSLECYKHCAKQIKSNVDKIYGKLYGNN